MNNLFLFTTMAPILPIIYIMLLNETKPKKNIILGATLPYNARHEGDVSKICGQYKRRLTACCLFLAALFVPGILFPLSSGEAMTFLMTWLLFVMLLPYIVYTIYHRQLMRLKKERGWSGSFTGKTVVDITAAAELKRGLSAWLFVPPVILCVAPVFIGFVTGRGLAGSLSFSIIMALTVASFYLFYRIINRQRADIVEDDSALNVALTRVRAHNWSRMWILMSWLTGIYALLLWLLVYKSTALLISTPVYTALILTVALYTEFSARSAQQKLTEQSGKAEYVDDDRFWINGMFYYNPNDRHLMVNKRTGLSATANFAHPVGKLIMIISVLTLAAMPFIGLFIMAEENTPVALNITQTQLIASHTNTYTIDLADITEVSLMDAIPEGTIRTNGTGLDDLLKGKFSMPGIGRCTLCLNPQAPPFIRINTRDEVYVFGAGAPGETMDAYAMLTQGFIAK